jgi:hypothetical protein
MRLPRSISHKARPGSRSGVALIITVIMLSVITFLAVAFLALSGREKGAVKTATDQTTARLAVDTAMVRAQADLLAGILASGNLANYDLLVSTNFIRWQGFDTSAVDGFTNVNYNYLVGGGALNQNQALQNLLNLFYSPSPPVFITNRLAGGMEFRSYIDLNRNGKLDLTGFLGVSNQFGGGLQPVILTNGLFATNYVVGDPQWIGGTERIELPHSSSNKFVYRFAYAAVPIGKTLDLNYIHNNAKSTAAVNNFLRNQGVGSWEINLAAFLADLNTNYWNNPLNGGLYYYSANPGFPSTGRAFDNAYDLWNWRRGGVAQASVFDLYGNAGQFAFENDWYDGYSAGLVKDNLNSYATDPDASRTTAPWSGADMQNHFFSMQDLFDASKTGTDFANRLGQALAQTNTYDQSTYYRLLAQLSTDSAPDQTDRLNLNYVNVGGLSATNFVEWIDPDIFGGNTTRGIPRFGVPGSVLFFTNLVDRLLTTYSQEWIASDYVDFTNRFQVDRAFGVTNIPVFVKGHMVYSPAVHRVLQMVANIWDAKPNTNVLSGYPTVFRPYFTVTNEVIDGNSFTNVYIAGFGEVQFTNQLPNRPVIDLTASTNLPSPFFEDDLVFGVPLIIGAVKGLPNFNEYSMDSVFTMTRRLELVKSGQGGQTAISQTNQFYTMSVYLGTGAEFWNSYRANYNRPVDIVVNTRVTLSLTNDNGANVTKTVQNTRTLGVQTAGLPRWGAWMKNSHDDPSFVVPLRTNIDLFVPSMVGYRPGSATFTTDIQNGFEVDPRLLFPMWNLSITNRVQAMVLERGTGRILDYVLLGDMNWQTNFGHVIAQSQVEGDPTNPFLKLWGTNTVGTLVSGWPGVQQQILASRGMFGSGQNERYWRDNTTYSAQIAQEIAKFKAFFLPSGAQASFIDPRDGRTYLATNPELRAYAPFSPTVTFSVPMTWQANDPLVHYIARDMLYVEGSGKTQRIFPSGSTNFNAMDNLGKVNLRYKPWPTYDTTDTSPTAMDVSLKDPLVTASDDWQFPTNSSMPTIGWLGRIHRGTAWQTIYLKASDLGMNAVNIATNMNSYTWAVNYQPFAEKWSRWIGNRDLWEGFLTRPATDRILFDMVTTAFNENASRGQLSVNQTNLAAWSAIFSGVVVLTNSTSTNLLEAGVKPTFSATNIEPAGIYNLFDTTTWSPVVKLVAGINAERTRTNVAGSFIHPGGQFQTAGDLLSVPELTDKSPFLNLQTNGLSFQRGVNDAAYEWLPQQIMSLVKLGEPRFVIYAYGQALRPAQNSIITSGPFFGVCTNYQITAEVAARAVVRVEGSADPRQTSTNLPPKKRYPPRLIVESYNYLGPE